MIRSAYGASMIENEFKARRLDRLTDADFVDAALKLGIEAAAILAVWRVESAGRPFLPDSRPSVRFEAHIFHRQTAGRFDIQAPTLSTPGGWREAAKMVRGPIGEWDRLEAAIALDRTAALSSASWGAPQIMGHNAIPIGYGTVEAFVADMCDSEAGQMRAFCRFIEANRLAPILRARDWQTFAQRYNGAGNVASYAPRIALAYQTEGVRLAQAGLNPLPPVPRPPDPIRPPPPEPKPPRIVIVPPSPAQWRAALPWWQRLTVFLFNWPTYRGI